jgi:phosphotransferase system IIA component
MRKQLFQTCLLLGTIASTALTATGQQVVHALTGKVTAIYPATKSIKITTDDGSEGLFFILTKTNTPLNFEKSVRAESTPAAAFTKTDAQVVVYYIGDDAIRTTVALEDLGAGPFVKTVGTIVKLDKHAHMITIKDDKGAEESFHIDAKTVGEATNGVVEGEKFDADKGAKVRVTATTENGAETALFIRAMSF